jgi:hypothetical protein
VANKRTSVSSLPVAMGIKTCFCDSLLLEEGSRGVVVVVMIVLYCILLLQLLQSRE